jgi:hypothetical protein
VIERPYRHGVRYSAFCDPSGGSNDSFALAVSHVEDGRAVLDLIREARPPFSPESVVGEFCETLKSYKIRRVQGDRYGGLWPAEQFAKRAVKYEPAGKTASQLFLELLPAINAGTVRLLQHRRLIDQLVNLERRTSFGTGRDTVGHPPGCHDDLAVAAAGSVLLTTAKRPEAWVGTYGTGGRVEYLAKNNPHMQQPRARDTIRVVQVKEQDVEAAGIRLFK